MDSNHRIAESKSAALPLGYAPMMVGEEGFEPPKREVTDLQSAAFGHFATHPKSTDRATHFKMVEVKGLEPLALSV